jgi:predicted lipoprotein with Yx(FWY)xxD motif
MQVGSTVKIARSTIGAITVGISDTRVPSRNRLTGRQRVAVAAVQAVAGTGIAVAVVTSASGGGVSTVRWVAANAAYVVPAAGPGRAVPPPSPPALTVEVATSPAFGPVLVDPSGMTLYRQVGKSDCTGSCQYRPLLTHSGQPLQLPPLVHGRLGTTTLANGSLQVTFDGWPLYRYAGDHATGDTNGVAAQWQVIKTAA